MVGFASGDLAHRSRLGELWARKFGRVVAIESLGLRGVPHCSVRSLRTHGWGIHGPSQTGQ